MNTVTQLDEITFMSVRPVNERPNLTTERKHLMRLRMALLLSVFNRDADHPLDDIRVNRRLDEMLTAVRAGVISLRFYRKCIFQPFEIIPGVFLKVNGSCTDAVLYREQADTVVFIGGAA